MLPARIPSLLVNGSSGIAVGMATNIPPHNLREVVAGLHALIDDPAISTEQLMRHIPGPDFPTGAPACSPCYLCILAGCPESLMCLRGQTVELHEICMHKLGIDWPDPGSVSLLG